MNILKTIRHDDRLFFPGDEDALMAVATDAQLAKMADRGLVRGDFVLSIPLEHDGPTVLSSLENDPVESPVTNEVPDVDDVSVSVTSRGTDEATGESGANADESGWDESVWEGNATDGAIELADKHGIDLSTVVGTGLGGRIIIADVKKLVD